MDTVIVNNEDVLQVVRDINITKAVSVDHLSARVLKDALMVLIDKLVFMYNLSFTTGIVPKPWKISCITPLQKQGDSADVSNLRPVALLPLPGKLAECLVHSQITKYIEENNLYSAHQGGFRKGRSIIDTIADFTDEVLLDINEGLSTVALFVDMRKAFDTVDHSILLQKISRLGLHPETTAWLAHYLSERVQKTYANGQLSSAANITCGVPQGSILGPMLYLIYVNDVSSILKHCSMKLYADDTVIYASADSPYDALKLVQNELDEFTVWCHENKLSINTGKTKAMLFGSRNIVKNTQLPNLLLNKDRVHFVDEFTYLGAHLDSLLDFESQAKATLKIVSHKIKILSRIRGYMSNDQAITIYKTKVLPYFDYVDILCIGTYQRSLKKLQKQQNRALHFCLYKDKHSNTNQLHIETGIPLLKDRHHMHLLNYMYKRKGKQNHQNSMSGRTRLFDAVVFDNVPPHSG